LYIERLSLLDGSLLDAAAALRECEISAKELTREALERIERLNPPLNAFITVTKLTARARAGMADLQTKKGLYRGPLHGIPIAHKDCFATKGIRTTGGSKILANRVPDHDAEIVVKLAEAGAVLCGKTNLHELCYGITSTNPHFGAVHNPWDLTRIPGGSSGGSAAAVAAGLVFAATGTDTGGSIRVPASFCGVVGLKPTYGAISRRGCLPLGITLDHVGPIARTVRDVAVVYEAMGGDVAGTERVDVTGLRVGVPANFFFDRLAPEVTAAIRHAVQTMAALGADVREVELPSMDELNALGRSILSAEASSIWKRKLALRPEDFGEDVRTALEQGCKVPAAEYLEAQRRRRVLSRKLAALWNEIDCLLAPVTPTTAPRIGETTIRIGGGEEDVRVGTTRLVRPFNVLGWPALAMPCGFSETGLPIGLQLVAGPGNEGVLFRAGAALEDALAGYGKRPGGATP
jgi:aspartyl-tRNA(Asn)/glutamyl-tRNA(Gln) amidotransferase subunit A